MEIEESELLILTLVGKEVGDFRTLMLEVVKATKESGFTKLRLTNDADNCLVSIVNELTK